MNRHTYINNLNSVSLFISAMMARPVWLLACVGVLGGGGVLAVHDSVLDVESFAGFRVYRVHPDKEEQLRHLDSLQASPFYDFWTEVISSVFKGEFRMRFSNS